MNRIELKYSPYLLRFINPFATSKGNISERKGLIISLQSSSGHTGFGDAAPYPELSSETYEEVLSAIENIDVNFKIDLSDIENSLDDFFAPINNLPSLRHGIEQAFLNLISKEKNIYLNQILHRTSKKEIKVNAVIGLLPAKETLEAVIKYIEQGFHTIKLKAGRDSFTEDFEIIKAVRDNCSEEIKIRVDVNGKWNFDEAVYNLRNLEPLNLEYVEQPVNSIQELVQLSAKTGVPIAADESLRTMEDASKIIQQKAAGYLILKPMLLGGVIQSLKIIKLAEENGIKCIITSSFESVIGRSFASFIASLTDYDLAHGLSTGCYFEKDLTADPYPVVNGKINFLN